MTSLITPKSRFNRKLTKADMKKQLDDMPTHDKLFKRKFRCVVPAAYLYDDEDFARGVAVTGDKRRDKQAANEPENVFLPIAADDDKPCPNILEFFEQEIPIELFYAADMLAVYDILQEHFKKMAFHLGDNPLMNRDKRARIIKDLQRFDLLAAKMHPVAHSMLPKHLAPNSVENRLRMLFNPVLQANKQLLANPNGEKLDENNVPAYTSVNERLPPSILKGTKRWQ